MATVTIYPSAYDLGTNGANFTNPGNMYANDTTYATVTQTTKNTTSQIYLKTFNYSSIPSGSTITGITVGVEFKMSTTSSIQSVNIQAYKSTTAMGSIATNSSEPATDTVLSNSNTGSWTYDDLANLRVLVENVRGNSTTACTISYDYVYATITYTAVYSDSCSISQASTIAGTDIANFLAPSSISQASTISATDTAIFYVPCSISQAQTLNATGFANLLNNAFSISQSSTIEAFGGLIVSESFSINQSSIVVSSSYITLYELCDISQLNTINATSIYNAIDNINISQSNTVVSSGYRTTFGVSSVSQTSSLSSSSSAIYYGVCSINQSSLIECIYTVDGGSGVVQITKVWNGNAWVEGTLKRFDGNDWVMATLKRWTGSEWI